MRPSPHLRLHHADGDPVGHKSHLHGHVHGHRRGPVQVLVLSADGAWYLQKDAMVRPNGRFTIACTFGDPGAESRHDYTVVALAADTKITDAVLAAVPNVPRSRAVRVRRAK